MRWAAELPLTNEGEVIAGVGVSGGTVEQDVAVVEAALKSESAREMEKIVG